MSVHSGLSDPDPDGFPRVCLCETGGVAVRVMNVFGPEGERGQSVTTRTCSAETQTQTYQPTLEKDMHDLDAIISRRCRLCIAVSHQRQREKKLDEQ